MLSNRRNHRKYSTKAGLPPGTLVHIGSHREEPITVELIEYSADFERAKEVQDLEELRGSFDNTHVSWIDVNGIHDPKRIEAIGTFYGIHNLVLEDILNTEHRPKVEAFEDHVFFTLKMMWFNEKDQLEREQVSIVFGKGYVLCFQERKGDIFDPIRERIRTNTGIVRKKGADYLVYRLVDSVVDNYFLVTERMEERIEELEEVITSNVEQDHMLSIQHIKREIIMLKRALLPLREAVSGLEKGVTELVSTNNQKYFRDVFDHLIQISDNLETNREVLSGLMEIHLANMNHRMNEVMKVLTVISSLFIPLTFIVGIYGMNFDNMPELKLKYGYYAAWGLMVAIFFAMLAYFRRKKWF
jgi:magnesium transporter